MANTDGNQVLDIVTNDDIATARENGFASVSPMKRAFALRYVIDYNHREAAYESGFARSRGIKLIREPLVAAMISYLQEETSISNIITADFIKTQYLNLIPMLAGEVEVPVLSPDGVQLYGKKFYPGELTSVLKELAKSTKFYKEGSGQGGGGVTVEINVAALLGKDAQGITIEGKKVE